MEISKYQTARELDAVSDADLIKVIRDAYPYWWERGNVGESGIDMIARAILVRFIVLKVSERATRA